MATTPNYLKPRSDLNLRDFQHAARLFVDDGFRLAPKSKFLFHVSFGINSAALKNIDLVQRHRNEINMLVKSADLPKFSITTETVNQYNRKKVLQTTHKYENITIKFHDDNMSLINQLWQNYYSYYYADPNSAKNGSAYSRNATKSSDFIPNAYGLDNGSTLPFFNYITIYQMSRKEFVSYTLKNPLIVGWQHGSGVYAQNELNEKTMTLAYEAVAYGSGKVTPGDPEGFALEHYDLTPSPLESRGDLDTASPSFISNINVEANRQEFVSNLTKQINTYQNTSALNNGLPVNVATGISTSSQGLTGLQGVVFPVVNQNNNTTTATQVNLTGN